MGHECCSGSAADRQQPTSCSPNTADHNHVHRNCEEENHCADIPTCPDGENCKEETCCDGESTCESMTLECCNSDTENCNKECIINAAAIECEKACEENPSNNGSAEHQHVHDEDGNHPTGACSTHLSKAFEKYNAYLESARCICRSILDAGMPTTCCNEKKKQSKANSHYHAHSTGKSNAVDNHGVKHHHHGMKRRGGKPSREPDLEIKVASNDQSSCCSGHDARPPTFKTDPVRVRVKEGDVEKEAGLEHVALVVDGMTCSGCGNKMERTLKNVPGVSSVAVNFVMGSAEFSLDPKVATAEEVIKGVQRASGFQCTRVSSKNQAIDVLASNSSVKTLLDLAIPGVSDISALDKKMARITYDPTIVGPRTLLDQIGPYCEGLAPPRDDPAVSGGRKRVYDQLLKTVVSAALTIPVVVLAWGDTLVDDKTRAYISIVLATLVQLIAVPEFYHPAISSLVHARTIEMDMLVVISITAAYVYSLVAFGFRMANHPLETSEFFETSTLLITLILLGRLVAAFARVRAVSAVSLRSLQTTTATVVEDGVDMEVDARLLQYGDKFRVLPHSKVPTDGIVISGSSEIDESMLTGESMPVVKGPRDAIIAGTVNGTGTLVVQLTRLPGKNTVTDIAELVEEAANMKPKIQDIADRVASWFVPVVASIALAVIIIWIIIGLKVRGEPPTKAIPNAITYAVAVLAVSCPCALGLAVPMVLVVAGGIAARGGVIIKSAECTERSRKVTDIVFDKTGTITEGELDVLEADFLGSDPDQSMAITKALVAGNTHPVSAAVNKHLLQYKTPDLKIEHVHVIPGAGIEGKYNRFAIRAGNPIWTETSHDPTIKRMQDTGMTILVITQDSQPIAVYGLRTRIRVEAARVVAGLSRRGIAIHMVSGDQPRAVQEVAQQVNIPNTAAQHTPAQKREYVASLMEQGKIVMFVGDGTNDAVAVTQADVGVQLGSVLSASDVTRGAADVVLLGGLEGIPFLLDVSRFSFRRMVFNFVWSAVYNLVAILLAAGAFVNVRIAPAYAGLGEIVSVVPVIVVAATMLTKKAKHVV